jgi:hypothetical protein
MDLSALGCRLRLGEDLSRGTAVTVRFESPEGASRLAADVSGVVIWSRLEGLSYQAGLKFGEGAMGVQELVAGMGDSGSR